ncbi:RHS repeat domain-containing protein, partial [Cognatilysobacter lacus]|uniref:RHS repeat domain-containing protein n=1 Tax=Cognatilysobacter lacus TaxID=1643323 RepID=UPI00165986A6
MTYTLQSVCTGGKYTFGVTPIQNPKKSCPATGGNPCNLATGAKLQTETDYIDPAAEGLDFRREYNSYSPNLYPGILGTYWGASVERHAARFTGTVDVATVRSVSVQFVRANGQLLTFNFDPSSAKWVSDPDVTEVLEETVDAQGMHTGWKLYTKPGAAYEAYDSAGHYIAHVDSSGRTVAFVYDVDGNLVEVRSEKGRKLSLEYLQGKLARVRTPEGTSIVYQYNANGMLEKVLYPDLTPADDTDNPYRKYLYESNVGNYLLTGIVDEIGNRYATWDYDASARAILSVHGPSDSGVDRTTFSYGPSLTTTVTSPLGASSTASFIPVFGLPRISTVSSPCPTCSGAAFRTVSYDSNGYPDVTEAFDGTLTDHDFNAAGQQTQRIDAKNDTAGNKRTTQTDWNASLAVPAERRVYNASATLVAKTDWTYNGRGQPLTSTQTDPATGTARTSTITYCEQPDVDAGTCPRIGLVTKLDGPRTDVSDIATYTYRMADAVGCDTAPTTCAYRRGDLWKVTNAKGQVVETLAYDGAGRPLSMKDANGVVTDLEYSARGWLTASKIRGADASSETDDVVTRMDYYPTGLVQKVTQPDGTWTAFEYDAAQRLTAVSNNVGDRVEYTLDNAGNRVKEDTKDASGNLRRTLSRVYNQLGQMQAANDAYGYATTMTYDASGNADIVKDAKGRLTDNDNDPLNRLVRTLQDTAGIKAETKFGYDALDNLTAVVDPKGLTTGYTYNGLGDLTKLVSPDTGTTAYTYDSAGNLKSKLDARGSTKQATYAYDVLNRLTGVS